MDTHTTNSASSYLLVAVALCIVLVGCASGDVTLDTTPVAIQESDEPGQDQVALPELENEAVVIEDDEFPIDTAAVDPLIDDDAIIITPQTGTVDASSPGPETPVEAYAFPKTPLTNVQCTGDMLTFTIANKQEKIWSTSTLAYPAPKDKAMMRLTVNNYNAYSDTKQFNKKSLANCIPQELAAKTSVTCTIGPVPYIKPNAYSQNSILLSVEGVYDQQTFTC